MCIRDSLNSVFYTGVSTIAVVVFSLAAGFAFAKLKSKATPFLHGSFIVGILLTLQSIMIPLFLMSIATGLYDSRLGVLIPYIGIGLPLGVYLCTEYIKSIPDEVIESARIDGAGYLRIFATMIAPMSTPVAATDVYKRQKTSASTQQVFVVPISRPAIYSFRLNSDSPYLRINNEVPRF